MNFTSVYRKDAALSRLNIENNSYNKREAHKPKVKWDFEKKK